MWDISPGTWETKVSNKEKREQRKKEKTPSDGSASPGGGNASNGSPQELPKPAPVQAPAAQKKKKGNLTSSRLTLSIHIKQEWDMAIV